MATPRKRIGELLVEARAIDQMQLQAALGHQRQWGGRLGQVLVQRGFITEQALLDALGSQLKVPVVQLARTRIDQRALQLVPAGVAEQLHLVPLEIKGSEKNEQLVVAMSDPTDLTAVDQLQFRTRKRIQTVLAGDSDIERAIRRLYYNEDVPQPATITHRPAPQPAARRAEAYEDSDLLGGDDAQVPGLVAWGEGEVSRAQPTPARAPAASFAQPPSRQPMMPAGIPPGFGSTDPRSAVRGRTIAAPQGQKAPAPPPMADLDPFAELEPELPDPLEGTDPHQAQRFAPPSAPPQALDFEELPDPLEGTSPDAWKADLEPIAAHLDDPAAAHGGAQFRSDAVPLEKFESLEELDVDMVEAEASVESMLETPSEAATQSSEWAQEGLALEEDWATEEAPELEVETASPLEAAPLPGEIDAAAEGWLTPAEDSVDHSLSAPAEAAWDAPVEVDESSWDNFEEAPAQEVAHDSVDISSGPVASADGMFEEPLDPALDPALGGAEPVTDWSAAPAEGSWETPAEEAQDDAWMQPAPAAEAPAPAPLEATAPAGEPAASEWLDEGWEEAAPEQDAAPEAAPAPAEEAWTDAALDAPIAVEPAAEEAWADATLDAPIAAEPAPAEHSLEAWDAEDPFHTPPPPPPPESPAEEWSHAAPEPEPEPLLEQEQPIEIAEEWTSAEPEDVADDVLAAAPNEPAAEPIVTVDDAWGAPADAASEPWLSHEPLDSEVPAQADEHASVAESQPLVAEDDSLSAWAGVEDAPAAEEPAAAHEDLPVSEPIPDPADDDALTSWAGAEEPAPELPAAEGDEAAAWASADEQVALAEEPPSEEPLSAEQPADDWAGFGADADETAPADSLPPAEESVAWATAEEAEEPAIAHDPEPAPQLDPAPVVEHSAHEDTTRTAPPGLFGWQWLGIAQPTQADVVRVMGCLVEVLVQRGMIDPHDLANALREAEELSRS